MQTDVIIWTQPDNFSTILKLNMVSAMRKKPGAFLTQLFLVSPMGCMYSCASETHLTLRTESLSIQGFH
jgi:hypothetical protein